MSIRWLKLARISAIALCAGLVATTMPAGAAISPATPVGQPEASASPGTQEKGSSAQADPGELGFEERESVTRHSVTIQGQEIDYTATAGTVHLRNDEGEPVAEAFYVSYTRDGADDPSTRPVTFSYNGGPGSAAVWVQMGAFGPKKVLADEEGFPVAPPGRLVDNRHSILDVTDLVFIDPIGTGFSRVFPGVDPKRFHGLEEDIRWVGEFIRLWTARNERWASPKFLAGESYGTTRSAGLSGYLQDEYGMYLNGIVLISTVLDWQTLLFSEGNDIPHITFLPTYAATAWYHEQLPSDLQSRSLEELLSEVERFALEEYALALLKGDELSDRRRREVAERYARFTGLGTEYVLRSNLRVDASHFRKELLRDEGKVVGRLDSRFLGQDRSDVGATPSYDPSSVGVDIGYVTLLNDYLRRELGFESDRQYESSGDVRPWSFPEGRFVNVAETLREAMTENPDLHVLITSGYYDLATPYFGADYTVDHMQLREAVRGNIDVAYYRAGHMMYIREEDAAKMRRDVVELIREATPEYPEE